MAVNKSAKYTTPDGEERDIRFSQASQFRISQEIERNGTAPHYFIIWAMLFDEDDNPPLFKSGHPRAGQVITAGWVGANSSPLDLPKMQAAVAEATTGAIVEKKIVEKMEQLGRDAIQKIAGSITGLSLESISDLPEVHQAQNGSSANSGGSPQESSNPSGDVMQSESETLISVPV